MNYTSIEQSKKLLELGLSPESADACYDVGYGQTKAHIECENFISYFTNDEYPELKDRYVPCWSVGALIELMPKMFYIEGKDDLMEVALLLAKDQVIYEYTEYDDNYEVFRSKVGNLIDCLYETVCWLLQNNYIKTEYL